MLGTLVCIPAGAGLIIAGGAGLYISNTAISNGQNWLYRRFGIE